MSLGLEACEAGVVAGQRQAAGAPGSQEGGPWSCYAHRWSLLGPPQRPSREDVEAALSAVRGWQHDLREAPGDGATAPPPPRALLLGVTPEIATMDWPPGTSLLAVDRSEAMIEAVLPKAGVPEGTRAVVADWRSLPVADGSIDVAIGDGCLSVFAFPTGVREVAREIRRALAPTGRLVMRLYTGVQPREAMATIEADLRAGRIGSFHVLKWRVAMALEAEPGAGVVLDDLHRALLDLGPVVSALSGQAGFTEEIVATSEAYRDSKEAYSFPTVAMLGEALSDLFALTACIPKHYELGDRCPTVTFTPLGA